MTPTLEEIRALFPRCPVCGYPTQLIMKLVLVRRGPSLRVAHEACAEAAPNVCHPVSFPLERGA